MAGDSLMHLPLQGIISRASGSSLLTGLVSWWSLDEASGDRVDAHGSNDLSDINTVTQAAGKQGNAAQFTTVNAERLASSSTTGLGGRSTDYSTAGWVYFDTLSLQGVIGNGTNASTLDYQLLLNTNFQFYVNQSTTNYFANATTFGAPSATTWYFVYCEYNGATDTIGISINDGTKDTGSGPSSPNTNDTAFNIGNQPSQPRYMNGRADEWAFWNRLLTGAEISEVYASGSGIAYPG